MSLHCQIESRILRRQSGTEESDDEPLRDEYEETITVKTEGLISEFLRHFVCNSSIN